MSFTEIVLTIGVGAFIVYASFNIFYFIEMRRTSRTLRGLIEKADENIQPSLAALRGALEDLRKATGDIAAITEDVREVADAARAAEQSLKEAYDAYAAAAAESVNANVAGLKAGVKTGLVTLISGLQEKRGSQQDESSKDPG